MRFFWISVAYRFAPVFEKGLLMAGKGGCGAAVRGVWGSGQRSTRVVELAGPHAVQEALPLVPVVDEDPVVWVAGHAHQHPLRASSQVLVDERDLEGAIAAAGPLPVLCDQIDAEFRNGRLGIHRLLLTRLPSVTDGGRHHSRFHATPQYQRPRCPRRPTGPHMSSPHLRRYRAVAAPARRTTAPPQPSSAGGPSRPRSRGPPGPRGPCSAGSCRRFRATAPDSCPAPPLPCSEPPGPTDPLHQERSRAAWSSAHRPDGRDR